MWTIDNVGVVVVPAVTTSVLPSSSVGRSWWWSLDVVLLSAARHADERRGRMFLGAAVPRFSFLSPFMATWLSLPAIAPPLPTLSVVGGAGPAQLVSSTQTHPNHTLARAVHDSDHTVPLLSKSASRGILCNLCVAKLEIPADTWTRSFSNCLLRTALQLFNTTGVSWM